MADKKRFAPLGTTWVCGACGKTAEDRYGIEGFHSYGWDESCMLNAVLCKFPRGLEGWEAADDEPAVSINDGTSYGS